MAHSRRVVRLREDLATAPSSMPEDRADLALAWIKLGDVQYRDRFETEGFASYNTALGILEPLAREFPESRRFADDLAHSYSRLAIKNWGRRDEAACRGLLAKATAQREMLERKFPGHATTWRTSAELQLTDCSLWIAMSNGPCEEADRAREGSLAALSKLLAMRPRNRHDLELAIWIQRNAANGFAIGSERYTAIRRDAMASLSKLMAEDPHRPELWWEYLFEALMMAESLCIAGNPDQAATELEVTADALAGAPLQARHWVQQSHAWKERLGWIRGKYGTAVDTALGKVEASVTRVE